MMDSAATLAFQSAYNQLYPVAVFINQFSGSASGNTEFTVTNRTALGFAAPYIKEFSVLGLISNL